MADHWQLLVWRPQPALTPEQVRTLAGEIRRGCVEGAYWLRAYAAMPERIALLFYPLSESGRIVARWESYAGVTAERWRAIRDDAELERAARYVESLPVRSRLAERPEDYPWSSLGWMREYTPAPLLLRGA